MDFSFFGTDNFAVKILTGLKTAGWLPKFIVTTPDRPRGRKLVLTPPPVKGWVTENKINYYQPAKLTNFSLPACKVAIVASYGKILPVSLLTQPKKGFVNIHPSLLPKYRGAAPLQAAILSGDQETGVTLMEVDKQMDHGAIIAQEKLILSGQNFLELRDQTAALGVKLITEKLPLWLSGELKATPQDEALATYTKKIEKEDGLINLADDPITNDRKIRAYTLWPGTYFFHNTPKGKTRVIIKKTHLNNQNELVIERVIPEGKKEMDYSAFVF